MQAIIFLEEKRNIPYTWIRFESNPDDTRLFLILFLQRNFQTVIDALTYIQSRVAYFCLLHFILLSL